MINLLLALALLAIPACAVAALAMAVQLWKRMLILEMRIAAAAGGRATVRLEW